jgi:hypothetical protein
MDGIIDGAISAVKNAGDGSSSDSSTTTTSTSN